MEEKNRQSALNSATDKLRSKQKILSDEKSKRKTIVTDGNLLPNKRLKSNNSNSLLQKSKNEAKMSLIGRNFRSLKPFKRQSSTKKSNQQSQLYNLQPIQQFSQQRSQKFESKLPHSTSLSLFSNNKSVKTPTISTSFKLKSQPSTSTSSTSPSKDLEQPSANKQSINSSNSNSKPSSISQIPTKIQKTNNIFMPKTRKR